MSKAIFKIRLLIISIVISSLVVSCASREDIVYFQNAKSFETIVDTETFEAKLKVGDILQIYISTQNPVITKPYNIVVESGSSSQLIDYLIDKDGNIDFPVLGKIKLVGLTVEEAKSLIKSKFTEGQLLKDPVVILRISNFRITVTGEVNVPGVYNVSGEKISILEALGMAGDLTIKGRRDNILIIRDFNGSKTYTRLDITSKEVFNSPVYYLTQNDVVYVEPNKSAISGAAADTRIGTIISVASFVFTTAIIFVTRN